MSRNEKDGTAQLDLLTSILPDVISAFRRLDADGQEKLFQMIATIFNLGRGSTSSAVDVVPISSSAPVNERFSRDRTISPKEFLLKKQPRTDVERVACLAYYLTNYRDQPHFKTLDISKLNTEAAQVKFSNPAQAVDNATKYGYLAPGVKGSKQLSAGGELYIDALPDREAAASALASTRRPRRKVKRTPRKGA